MQDKMKIRLTAAELAGLWGQYMSDSASSCVISHFLAKVEDEEIRPILKTTLEAAKKHLRAIREIYQSMNHPIPIGFTEDDVKPNAPRLFSDTFVLMYLRNMSVLGMAASSLAIGNVTRQDVVDFHKMVLDDAIKLQDQTRGIMLKQGTYVRPPFISISDKAEMIKKQSFLAGFIGDQRVLTAIEITHLFINVQTNAIGKAIIMGFAQVAQNEEVMKYFLRGKKLAQKHVDLFSNILIKEDLPAPMSWDSSVTDSTSPPFSDKLMMFHVSSMIAAGIGNYGTAVAASPRRDV